MSMEFDTEHFDLLVMRTRFAQYAKGLRNLVSLEKGNVERHAFAWAALKLCAILSIEKI